MPTRDKDHILGFYLNRHTPSISAYIAEPVSGHALAAAFPPDEHFKRIRQICDKYDVLMILDEVMNGVGRTGKWFAYQH